MRSSVESRGQGCARKQILSPQHPALATSTLSCIIPGRLPGTALPLSIFSSHILTTLPSLWPPEQGRDGEKGWYDSTPAHRLRHLVKHYSTYTVLWPNKTSSSYPFLVGRTRRSLPRPPRLPNTNHAPLCSAVRILPTSRCTATPSRPSDRPSITPTRPLTLPPTNRADTMIVRASPPATSSTPTPLERASAAGCTYQTPHGPGPLCSWCSRRP